MDHTDSITLQLEAFKLLQQWSIWLITLSIGFIGAAAFGFKGLLDTRSASYARWCLLSLVLTVFFAVWLVGAIPAEVQKITGTIEITPVAFGFIGFTVRGIYGSLYLDCVPLWVLTSGQRVFFLFALFFGAMLICREANKVNRSSKP